MRQRIQREVVAWFWVALVFMLINGTIGQARVIPSGSMENTMLVGDHLIMSRIGYDAGVPFTNWHVPLWRNPHRQQVIIFKPPFAPESTDLIKRTIGLPGDTIDVRGGNVYVNGTKLPRCYAVGPTEPAPAGSAPPGYAGHQVSVQGSGQLLFRDGRQPHQFVRQPFLGLRPAQRHHRHTGYDLHVARRTVRCVGTWSDPRTISGLRERRSAPRRRALETIVSHVLVLNQLVAVRVKRRTRLAAISYPPIEHGRSRVRPDQKRTSNLSP